MMRGRVRKFAHPLGVAIATLVVAGVVAPAMAQTGAIHVTVIDTADRAPLPGATVTVTNDQYLVAPTTAITDANGQAVFPILRAGSGYNVDVHMPGFSSLRRAEIRLRTNSIESLVFQMGRPLEERVEVVAGADVIDLDEVGSSTRFSDDFIESLPKLGRFYQEILPLTPGVNDEDGDGNPNVHGSRSRDFRAEVSGVSNVDPLTGQWLSRINPDTIEELEVIPLGAGVEFGRAQGGFARVIQKQGTNEFEGTFNLLYQSSKLDGDGAGNVDSFNPAPDFENLQPAIQISGPIVRDKLWYRFSHEYIKREEPVNTLGGFAVTTMEQQLHADQISWQVSPRNKIAFQFQRDPLMQDGLGLSSSVPLESTRTLEQGGDTWSVTWTAPQSARLLFDSTVAWQDHEVNVIPTAPDDQIIEQNCILFFNIPSLLRTRCRNVTSGQTSGPHHERSEDDRQRFTARSQMTAYTRLFGQSHRIKLGFIAEEEEYRRDLTRKPDMTMQVIPPLFGDPTAIVAVRVALPRVGDAKAEGTNWALYLEDQWKPRNNLSVSLGLRLDREEISALGRTHIDPLAEALAFDALLAADGRIPEEIPRLVRDRYARETFTAYEDIRNLRQLMADALLRNVNTIRLDDVLQESTLFEHRRDIEEIEIRNTNFSPRLSFAWDPWSNGRTKIAFSAGRYYDKIFLAVPLVEVEPVESTISFSGSWFAQGPPFFTNTVNLITMTPPSARMVDRDLRTPYQDEYSFAFERELGPETSIKVTWLKRSFEDQFQDFDINQAPGDYGYCRAGNFFGSFRVQPNTGTGDFLRDPLTGQFYSDTDPGIGDGKIDDCRGDIGRTFFGTLTTTGPDNRDDLYVLNPAWRELLMLGNFNSAEYEGLVLQVVRRLHQNWQLDASYTWSEAMGDAEDFDLLLGNEQNQRDDEVGYLDYDQRHVVKLNIATYLRQGWRAGAAIRWESGLPYSVVRNRFLDVNFKPLYPFEPEFVPLPRFRYPSGQRNDERNVPFWTFDFRLQKEFALGRSRVAGVSIEVLNALNDDVLNIESQTEGSGTGIIFTPSTLEGTRRFGRRWQIGLRMTF